jgi:two-component system chemotaxis response regulator CheB
LDAGSVDVIVLDLEMAELDGLETLRRVRERGHTMPVVIFSSHTRRGARITIQALLAGASDYVTKPQASASAEDSVELIRNELVPRLRALLGRGGPSLTVARRVVTTPDGGNPFPLEFSSRPGLRNAPGRTVTRSGPPPRVEVLVVGASTGGPTALAELLSALPASLAVPIAVVQHSSPQLARTLAEQLATRSPLPVRAASHGETIGASGVWIAPGGTHLVLEGRLFGLSDAPPEHSCRPSVDVLFRSAARSFGAGVLAVVLTGMGEDGVAGARAVVDAGGQVLAQDPGTASAPGMPGRVADAGLASSVLSVPDLAAEILLRIGRSRNRSTPEADLVSSR